MTSCDNCIYRFSYIDSSGNNDGEGCEKGLEMYKKECNSCEVDE